jgi:hypothetical protein
MDNLNINNEFQAYEYIYRKIYSKSYTYFTDEEVNILLKYVTLEFLESLCFDKVIDFKNCMFKF